MSCQGWVSVHRRIKEHWLWKDKPFSKGQAWIDMLMRANHADNKFLLGNELVEVKAGSFITSIQKLEDEWGWSNTKVLNFLKLLESDGMIKKKSDTKKTVITIEKYSDFQLSIDTKTIPKRYENDTKTIRKHTNNNENNENNENNNNIYIGVPDELKEVFSEFSNMRKRIKKPITTKNTVTRILNKLDKLASTTEEKIEILNQSIDHCWQDVYALKGEKGNGQHETAARNYRSEYDELDIPTF